LFSVKSTKYLTRALSSSFAIGARLYNPYIFDTLPHRFLIRGLTWSEILKYDNKDLVMKTKTIMLCTVALGLLGACSTYNPSGPRYTPRAEISQNNYTQTERQQDHMDVKSFTKYEHREQCQQYRKPPRNYKDNCVSNMMQQDVVAAAQPSQRALLPIVSSYTVLFDFDKSDVRSNELATLDRAMNEIAKYNPTHVTVTGYTDSRGTSDYNQTLSLKREEAVSAALLQRGIKSRILDREARGEYEQAVKTADGVKNQQNRRVVIDFRR
jgi:outer membrane protein OmpA-like peptidoglycan-associated protein